MKYLLINYGKDHGDYLADLITCHILNNPSVEVYTNNLPPYLFSDYEHKVYGRGFTVFRKLDPKIRDKVKILSSDQIRSALNEKYFDRVVYTNIWRRFTEDEIADYFDDVTKNYPKEDVLVFDGNDEPYIQYHALGKVMYYKRELNEQDPAHFVGDIYPISFSFPIYNPLPERIEKRYILAPVEPRFGHIDTNRSYYFHDEHDYYTQYSFAYFGTTKRKGGWDCMRHYEIIACNCLPYFLEIEVKPKTMMVDYPVDLQIKANDLFFDMLKSNCYTYTHHLEEWEEINKGFQVWLKEKGMSNIYDKILYR